MPRYIISLPDGRFAGPYELDRLKLHLAKGELHAGPQTRVASEAGMRWIRVQEAVLSGAEHYVQAPNRYIHGPLSADKLRELVAAERIHSSSPASPAPWAWQPLSSIWPNTRQAREQVIVSHHFPRETTRVVRDGREVWVFPKRTELGTEFTLAVYMDPDEGGYVAQLVSPELEQAWRHPHIGHIFKDGVICLGKCMINGTSTMRATNDMLVAYSKACLWAEGIAVMLQSRQLGTPGEFPFSNNNLPGEVDPAR